MTDNDRNFLNTYFSIGVVVGSVPSQMVQMRYIRPSVWIPLCEISWSALVMSMAAAKKVQTLYVLRFFVGLLEACSSVNMFTQPWIVLLTGRDLQASRVHSSAGQLVRPYPAIEASGRLRSDDGSCRHVQRLLASRSVRDPERRWRATCVEVSWLCLMLRRPARTNMTAYAKDGCSSSTASSPSRSPSGASSPSLTRHIPHGHSTGRATTRNTPSSASRE
jgi:hypothetical protein